MILAIVAAFLAAIGTSLLVTPLVMRLATTIGAVDLPGGRKIHMLPIPRLGGVTLFLSVTVSLGVLWALSPALVTRMGLFTPNGLILGGALLLVLLLGVWDDMHALSAARKFGIQLLLATVVYLAGFRISGSALYWEDLLSHPTALDYLLTVLWIVGVTNALNLIDGLDGLASGVATISCFTLAPIALLNNDQGTALLGILLAGSVIGFLRYNFNPARIFLGDSGSLFLGFALALLSMRSSTKTSTAFSILVPVLSLGVPIIDTMLSVARRVIRSLTENGGQQGASAGPLRAMFVPDKEHIHHKLLASGLSHRRAVIVLYLVSCTLGVTALAVTIARNAVAGYILGGVLIATMVGIRRLGYREMALLSTGALLPLYEQKLFQGKAFLGFLDGAFVIASFLAAHLIADWGTSPIEPLIRNLVIAASIVTPIQLIALWAAGIYRGTIRHMGIHDFVRLTKAVVLAALASWLFFQYFYSPGVPFSGKVLLLDFYFLLTSIIGSRASFGLLKHFANVAQESGRKALIYGAGPLGGLVLDKILSGEIGDLRPVGFLDDDPLLAGKRVRGYEIFGGHWELPTLRRTHGIEEVILADDEITPDARRQLITFARREGIGLRRLTFTIEDLHSECGNAPAGPEVTNTHRDGNSVNAE